MLVLSRKVNEIIYVGPNKDNLVAIAHISNGNQIYLHQNDMEELVKSPSTGKFGDIVALQLYIHPKDNSHNKNGTVGKYINSCEVLGDGRLIRKTRAFKSNGDQIVSQEALINQQLDSVTNSLIEYLQDAKKFKIKKISVEYVTDVTDLIWLSIIPELITDRVEATNPVGMDNLVRSDSGGSSNIDVCKRPQSREVISRSGSRSGSRGNGRNLNSAGSMVPNLPTILSPTNGGFDGFTSDTQNSLSSAALPAIINNHSKCMGDFCKYNDLSAIPGIALLDPTLKGQNEIEPSNMNAGTPLLQVISNKNIMLARSERRFVMAELG